MHFLIGASKVTSRSFVGNTTHKHAIHLHTSMCNVCHPLHFALCSRCFNLITAFVTINRTVTVNRTTYYQHYGTGRQLSGTVLWTDMIYEREFPEQCARGHAVITFAQLCNQIPRRDGIKVRRFAQRNSFGITVEIMILRPHLVCMLLLAVCWEQSASRMALETQTDYLDHIYLQVKNRPLRDGELNLLPDDTEPGFANTVRCVPESEEGMYI